VGEVWLLVVIALIVSYLLGSIPSGYWYGRLRGVDIRTVGSGNIGASNVQRTFGTISGIGVLLVDVGKGFIAAYFLSWFTPYPQSDLMRVGCGVAAICGHTFPLFLNFKGGKGVATTFGVLLGLVPISTIFVFLAFAGVVAVTRYISAGSLVSALLFPILIWWRNESGQFHSILILSVFISLVIIIRHRANIGRILRGEENRLGQRVAFHPKEKRP